MLVLGIESTCDETACSLVEDGKTILSNVITSQIDLHRSFGGVVPELACRRHIDVLLPVIRQALEKSGKRLQDIDLIAVACEPGLIGALMIGLTAAKSLSLALKIPFVGVNHVEAHLYAALMSAPCLPPFPCLGLVLSGGHTLLVEIESIGTYRLLGQTCDDAIGEAFDKAAKLMHLPYPGGPEIEKLAKEGNPARFAFKGGTVKGRPLDFSFSGLKTAVFYAIQGKELSQQDKKDVAAAFQQAAIRDVGDKIEKALLEMPFQTIVLGGGVTNNQALRETLRKRFHGINLLFPPLELTLDNAAMIAGLGYHVFLRKGAGDPLDLEARPIAAL